jgi:alcohol dehydrogenase class IV
MATIWNYPTRIVFGAGAASRAGEEARLAGIGRALILTDAGVMRAGLIEPIRESLRAAALDASTFDAVEANPSEANIEEAARAFAASGADGVVAVGGGSPIDAAKLVVLRSRVKLTFEELDDAIDGGKHVPPGLPPVIAMPTTAGTGSEVGRSGVLTVRSTNRKTVVFSPHLMPWIRCSPAPCRRRPRPRRASTRSPIVSKPSSRRAITPWPTPSLSAASSWSRLISRTPSREATTWTLAAA